MPAALLIAATAAPALAQPGGPPPMGPPRGEGPPPMGPPRGEGPPPMGPPPAAGAGPNLRGMASQFFAAPTRGGTRVAACPNNNSGDPSCAQRTADQWCTSSGWRRANFVMQETVAGRVTLADVLCVNVG